MDRKKKNNNAGGFAVALGLGAALGAAALFGFNKLFNDKEETKNEESKNNDTTVPIEQNKHKPPPIPTPVKVPADLEERLCCPISLEIMNDPVVTPYGHTFERKNIEEYITNHGICPITRAPLKLGTLAPNYTVRDVLEQLNATHSGETN